MEKLTTIYIKIKELFLTNKRMIIPLIPLALLVVVFIVWVSFSIISSQPQPQDGQILPTPTSVDNSAITPDPSYNEAEDDHSIGDGDGPILTSNEEASNFEKKETLLDGSIKNYLTSERKGRPNIIITSKVEQTALFESAVLPPNTLPLLSDYLIAFGQPEQTFNGSKFYGSNARTYIYSENLGVAFIGDPQKNTVFETHHFTQMSVTDYIKKFGQDIVSTTPAP